MRRSFTLFTALALMSHALFAAPPAVKTVPWVANNPLQPHNTWSGKAIRLKGVSDSQGANFQYTWDFGDGTAVATGIVSDRYAIEASHTYAGSAGTIYTARLSVRNTTTGESALKEYYVQVLNKSLSVEVNVAIDEGLWYLHKLQTRSTNAGLDYGSWGTHHSNTAANVHAFEVGGHLDTGTPDDPYTETVQRGLRQIFANLTSIPATLQSGGRNPDSNGNGFVLTVAGSRGRESYEMGIIADAIIATGRPNGIAPTGPTNVAGRTFKDIVQDLLDYYAYGQYDAAGGGYPILGGWRYGADDFPDNSASQWAAIAIIPAVNNWGCTIPTWLKPANLDWLKYSQTTSGTYDGVFGYTDAGFNGTTGRYGTTPSGMVQLSMHGIGRGNIMWDRSETYLRDHFGDLANENDWRANIKQYHYGMFAFVKAMLTHDSNGDGVPEPIALLQSKTPGVPPIDWYAAQVSQGDPTDGFARSLVDDQQVAGNWSDHSWTNETDPYGTAWAIIMLRGTLFDSGGPVAVARANPNPAVAGQNIRLDGTTSFHQDSAKSIVSWQWDLNNDGVFDATGPFASVSFPSVGSYPIRLRVTDNGSIAQSADDILTIRVATPPLAPTADAGGPYIFCPGVASWFLDGTRSSNPDDGGSEIGKPGDRIIEYAWELNGDNSFNDAFGPTPNVTTFFSGKDPGNYVVQLRVTDNTALSYPSSGQPNLTSVASSIVVVKADCQCIVNLAARPKATKIQLTWTNFGSDRYNIYRATTSGGPYTQIDVTASSYSTYLDNNVQTGRTYFYVVRPTDSLNREQCQSNEASATPVPRPTGPANTPPVANAGPGQSAAIGQLVLLDGSRSSDANGDPLTYRWAFTSRPTGSTATLSATNVVSPTFRLDVAGNYVVSLIVNDGKDDSAPSSVTISTFNTPPVANAGPNQSVVVGMRVTLDGTASSDVDRDPLTYAWSFATRPAGSAAALTGGTTAGPAFTVDAAGTYVVRLIVNDGKVNSAPATVTITTQNSAPVANAGPSQTVFLTQTVTLDGSGSSDVDGDPLTPAWSFLSKPAGSAATLSNPAAIKPTFVADKQGSYVLQLIVSDGTLVSPPVTVAISTQNSPPVANAGPDQTASVGQLASLDGSRSSDVDGNLLTYRWSLTRPAGSTAILSDATAVSPTFRVDKPGAYIAQLIVNDGIVDSTPDTVSITTLNVGPVADAGRSQTISVPRLFTLDGSRSSDVDGDPLVFFWSLLSKPAGSAATLTNNAAVKPRLNLDLAGTYSAQLIVDDGTLDSAPATVTLTTLNSPPVADAGLDRTSSVGQTVTLDGSGSSDFNGNVLNFFWSFVGRPAGSTAAFSDITAVNPTFSLDRPGDYVAQLIVNDGAVDSAPDTVRISTLNSRPIARAGRAQTVAVAASVQLDGSASSDPDGDSLTFRWAILSRPAGSSAVIIASNPPPPTPAQAGIATSHTAPSVSVSQKNARPTLARSQPKILRKATTNTIRRAAATTAQTVAPAPAAAAITASGASNPTFIADRAGDYVIQLIVNDGKVDSAPSTVTISTINSKPIANAGPAQTVLIGATVQLSGAASSDPDNNPLTYRWALTARPNSSSATLSSATSVNPTFVGDRAGTFVAQLIVDDGTETADPTTVRVTVVPPQLTVPNVVGLAESAAEASIAAASFTVGSKTSANSATVPLGSVISQSPVAGASAPQGAPVSLVISLGATSVTVPNVIGLARSAAESAVVASGLTVGTVTLVNSTTIPANQVFGQSPGAGSVVAGPSPVNLTVSAGVGSTLVPSLSGLTQPQASAALFSAQLTLGGVTTGSHPTVPAGRIFTQLPTAGASATPGASVDVAISTGPLAADGTAPAVALISPTDGSSLSYLTDVVATVTDTNLALYQLQIAPASTVDASNPDLDDPDYVLIAQGTTPVTNGAIGKIDPTTLLNDNYVIRLKATDAGGLTTARTLTVGIGAEAKLGRFSLEFIDLSVPLAGIPIEVVRRYDSFQSAKSGDFGYGWSLGLRDAGIRELLRPSFAGPTLAPDSRLYITAPDGRRLGFTAKHRVISVFIVTLVEVSFTPDPGIYEKLDILDGNQPVLRSGVYLGGLLGSEIYVPQKYRLTLASGAKYDYDRSAGLEKITDPSGNTITFTATAITHSGGLSIPLVRDAQNRITRITDPEGQTIDYGYGADGDLVSVTDRTAARTLFTYKAVPRHYLDSMIDPLGRLAARTEYDANGRVTAIIDALGNRQEQNFDPASFTGSRTDARGNATTILYDTRGNVLRETKPEGGIARYEYNDPANPDKPTKITDPEGNSFTLTYDAGGHITQTTVPGTTPLAFQYGGEHLTNFTTPLGAVSAATYDAAGRITSLTPPGSPAIQLTRGASGLVTQMQRGANSPVTFEYAANGQPSKLTREDGSSETFTYDGAGRLKSRIDPLGKAAQYRYDRAGRLVGQSDPTGAEETFTYDATGELSVHRMRNGMQETFQYDGSGKVAGHTAGGERTSVQRDGDGRLNSIRDPAGNEVTVGYDRDGNMNVRRDAFGKTTQYLHDGNGDRREHIDRLGRRRVFSRDYLGRLTKEEWFSPSGTLVRTFTLTYDADGRLATAGDAESSVRFITDALGRSTSIETRFTGVAAPFVLSFTRDITGELASVTDSLGASVASTRNPRGFLLSDMLTVGAESWRVERTLNAKGQPTELRRFVGAAAAPAVTTQLAYDDPGWLRSLNHFGTGGAALASFAYTRDASGMTTSVQGTDAATFTHDALGRLTGADRATGQDEAFTYAANGNRATYTASGTFTSAIGAGNRLLGDGRFTYTYDDEGNVTEKRNTATGGAVQFVWDHRNRLTQARFLAPGGALQRTVEYRYDIFNRRIATLVDGALQYRTVYGGDLAWADFAPDGGVLARYLHGPDADELWAIWRPATGLTWTLSDKQSNIVQTTSAAGAATGQRSYAVFGGILQETGAASFGRWGFQGREHDADTGLINLRLRWLDPESGRFLSEDPLDFLSGSTNPYAFADNRPTDISDPTGALAVIEYSVLIQEFVGGKGVKAGAKVDSPSSGEIMGAFIGFFQGFGFANLTFIAEVLGDPSGDLGAAVCRAKKYSYDFYNTVSYSKQLDKSGFAGAFWEGASLNFKVSLTYFSVVECSYKLKVFEGGGFKSGLDFGFTRLEGMFGASCDTPDTTKPPCLPKLP